MLDADGKVLVTANAVDALDREIHLEWRVPADGKYRLRMRDLQNGSRGGREFIYRLTVRPAKPNFALRIEPDYVNVVQGGKTECDLYVRRMGGFTGPIDLTATGLPDGVKIEPTRIPDNQTRVKLVVSAAADARPADVARNASWNRDHRRQAGGAPGRGPIVRVGPRRTAPDGPTQANVPHHL